MSSNLAVSTIDDVSRLMTLVAAFVQAPAADRSSAAPERASGPPVARVLQWVGQLLQSLQQLISPPAPQAGPPGADSGDAAGAGPACPAAPPGNPATQANDATRGALSGVAQRMPPAGTTAPADGRCADPAPPVSQPPAVQPPVSQPPVAQPPASPPPGAQPPGGADGLGGGPGGGGRADGGAGGGSDSGATPPRIGPPGDPNTLKGRAAAHGMYMGTAVSAEQIKDPRFTEKVKAQFNSVTPENEMKWGEIAKNGYGPADKIVDWAKQNGMDVRGHTLVWHNQAPDDLAGKSAGEVKSAMVQHIDNTVKHFGHKVGTWDVVNEAFADGGGKGFRDSPLSKAMGGQAMLDTAFTAARQAGGPGKELVLNDYCVETKNAKSDAMYEAVKGMKQRGIPIDTVGMQAHMTAGQDVSTMAENIKRFRDLGVKVQITELDVKGGDDAAKAKTVHEVWNAAVKGGASGITTWGATDKDSWLQGDPNLGANAGLPFDKDMKLKRDMLAATG
jgi:GH35 family endo-1,4-beta-xylanase